MSHRRIHTCKHIHTSVLTRIRIHKCSHTPPTCPTPPTPAAHYPAAQQPGGQQPTAQQDSTRQHSSTATHGPDDPSHQRAPPQSFAVRGVQEASFAARHPAAQEPGRQQPATQQHSTRQHSSTATHGPHDRFHQIAPPQSFAVWGLQEVPFATSRPSDRSRSPQPRRHPISVSATPRTQSGVISSSAAHHPPAQEPERQLPAAQQDTTRQHSSTATHGLDDPFHQRAPPQSFAVWGLQQAHFVTHILVLLSQLLLLLLFQQHTTQQRSSHENNSQEHSRKAPPNRAVCL
eukprot:GHVU01006371.1.p1 GENE.GHVU01006371.1~~GHVU01006371.1.p1  ORF type:complete len:289 (-),score=35.64 GHVU01006371.1:315-1181(-)